MTGPWLYLTTTGAAAAPPLDAALTDARRRAASSQTPGAVLWSPTHGAIVAIAAADFVEMALGSDRADQLIAARLGALTDPDRQRAAVLAPDAAENAATSPHRAKEQDV